MDVDKNQIAKQIESDFKSAEYRMNEGNLTESYEIMEKISDTLDELNENNIQLSQLAFYEKKLLILRRTLNNKMVKVVRSENKTVS